MPTFRAPRIGAIAVPCGHRHAADVSHPSDALSGSLSFVLGYLPFAGRPADPRRQVAKGSLHLASESLASPHQ
eukprot:5487885-Alexandrium_andersonii.AAC.1